MIGSVTVARVVIAAVLVALGVSACSGSDPEPNFAPPSSSAPSDPSTSPVSGPTAPTLPPEAMGDDAAAAEAFVKFYWETVNYAQETGDTAELEGLADRCKNCDNGIEFIEGVYSGGGAIVGGEGTPRRLDTSFTKLQGDWWAVVDCDIMLTPQDVDQPGTKNDEHFSGGKQEIRMYLQPVEGSWVVRTMGFR